MPSGENYATRQQIRRMFSRAIDEPWFRYYPTLGYAVGAGGSTNTIVDSDTIRMFDGWEFKDAWIYVIDGDNAGSERKIMSYTSAAGTFTVAPNFGASFAESNTYEVHQLCPATYKNELINRVIRTAYPDWWEPNDVDLVICEDETYIDSTLGLPLDIRRPLQVFLEPHHQGVAYVATSGTTTTAVVDETLTTNQYAGQQIVFYDGTGRGQYSTVSSNTTTTITFTAVSTAPANGTKFLIKESADWSDWHKVPDIRWGREDASYYGQMLIPDRLQRYRGDLMRLYYIAEPGLLNTEIATTYVPVDWILAKMKYLYYSERMNPTPNNNIPLSYEELDARRRLLNMYRDETEMLRRRLKFNMPPDTAWSNPTSTSNNRWRGQFFSVR